MTLHAILEIADTLFQMLGLNLPRIMFVAAVARVQLEVRRHVARLARDGAALAVIEREGMIERGPLPGAGVVALRAVQTKRPRCSCGSAWQPTQVCGVPLYTLLTWHLAQVTLTCAPVSLNTDKL